MRAPLAMLLLAATALTLGGCRASPPMSQERTNETLGPGEFGKAIDPGQPAKNIQVFDTLDFDVFSNQKWDRLHESHADDIIVSWPDGYDTHGIKRHIEDLK